MDKYLVFQLYGPMASWGEAAPGEVRHTLDVPTKSALLGLLECAMGIPRESHEIHEQFAEHYDFIVCGSENPKWFSDYHTVQIPKQQNKREFPTRREELSDPEILNTVVSQRDYFCDAWWLVAVRAKDQSPYSLEELASALMKPKFIPFLGRKANPTGLPFSPRVMGGLPNDILRQAAADFMDDFKQLKIRLPKLGKLCYWEGELPGLIPSRVLRRRDVPLNRRNWFFRERMVNVGELFNEEEACISPD